MSLNQKLLHLIRLESGVTIFHIQFFFARGIRGIPTVHGLSMSMAIPSWCWHALDLQAGDLVAAALDDVHRRPTSRVFKLGRVPSNKKGKSMWFLGWKIDLYMMING